MSTASMAWDLVRRYRFPFVKPRIPTLAEVEPYWRPAREANYFTNFGPVSRRLEADLADTLLRGWSVVMCSNCTSGLTAALMALAAEGPVLVPAFTFQATASAVLGAGLAIVTGDVDAVTGVLRASEVARAVEQRGCRAVIAVRPYGIWCSLEEVAAECRRLAVPLVIDNAAGLGVASEVVAEFGLPEAIEVFSLHATKPFGVGEGGAVALPAFEVDRFRSTLNFGFQAGRSGPGLNGKMDELTAAVGCAVLDALPGRVTERQEMARYFNAAAAEAGLSTFCAVGQERRATWQCFPVLLRRGADIDRIIGACAVEGLQARRYYHPVLEPEVGTSPTPNARDLSDRAVCLPVYDGPDRAEAGVIWDIFLRAIG